VNDNPVPEEPAVTPTPARDRLVWLAPLIILIAIAGAIGWRWSRPSEFAWLRVPQEQIHLPATSRLVDRVPVEPGALAGANLVLITLDTTRAGRIGCYGNSAIATPIIDGLANDGLAFTDALAPAPTTLPSHTSILTGLYPVHHGVRANGRFRLADEHPTLASLLNARGYATGAVISAFVLDSSFGLSQGFDRYNDNVELDGFNQELGGLERRARVTTDRALSWLEGVAPRQPFFLWVHYFDPHANYAPPEPYLTRYASNPYDGEIASVDEQIGRLMAHLDAAGLAENTLVVITADHGESLGEHDEHTHGYLLYDVTLRVPLILRCGKRLGAGAHVDRRVSLVDVAPTVLSLLGINTEVTFDGVDLTQPIPANRPLFAETYHGWIEYGWAALLAVYAGDYKLIHGPDPEMYDLAHDPTERENLVAQQAERVASMTDALSGLFGSELQGDAALDGTHALGPEELARLQGLGYAFGGGSEAAQGQPRVDPKARIDLVNSIFEIQCYYQPLGKHRTAVQMLEALVDKYPDSYSALYNLGLAYWADEQPDKAEAALRECIALRPTAAEAPHRLATWLIEQGDFAEAVDLLTQLSDQESGTLGVQCDLAKALVALKRYQEAAAHARIAFGLDSSSLDAVNALAETLPRIGRSDELRDRLETALAEHPARFAIRRALAQQLLRLHRYDDAETLLRQGVEAAPQAIAPRVRLALFLLQRPDEAKRDPAAAAALLAPLADLPDVTDVRVLLEAARAWLALGKRDLALRVANRARDLAERTQRADQLMDADAVLLRLRESVKPQD